MKRPLAVALTGGIAAGKSEALQAFARHGAAVISSDDVVHRLYREDEGLQAALRERWGERVFRDGAVDRKEVGRIVFADRAELAWLESELHPRVRAATDAWLGEQTCRRRRRRDPAPLRDRRRGALRPRRRRDRAGRGAGSATRRRRDREDRLVPEEEKVRRADYCYVNDGSLEELDAFVAGVLEELRRS